MPRARLAATILAGVAAVSMAAAALAGCSSSGPPVLDVSGDVFTHDPAFVAGEAGEPSFVYSTGNGQVADGNIQVRRSDDGESWEHVGEVWQEKPAWLDEAVPGVDNLWAPELFEHGGTWYLYYSASTFGKNRSVIALATNTTLDPADPGYEWVDRGPVITSDGTDFNAIDPGIVEGPDGSPWMSFGSFWSGIRMVELEWPSGLRAGDGEPLRLADRQVPPNAIEAPYIIAHDDAYYLFVSKGFCCKGVDSTYSIVVGRSETIDGPYLDANGVSLLEDGGTVVIETDGTRIGPGGQSVSGGYLAFHYYDGDAGGMFRLGLLPIDWRDGWPVVAWPDP